MKITPIFQPQFSSKFYWKTEVDLTLHRVKTTSILETKLLQNWSRKSGVSGVKMENFKITHVRDSLSEIISVVRRIVARRKVK